MRLVPAAIRRRIEHRPGLARIIGNVGWLTGDKLLRMGLGVVITVWMARYLGPDDFGVISYATAFVAVFGIIATIGLQHIVVRDLVKEPESRQLTLGTTIVLQLVGGILAFGLALLAINLARPDDTVVRMAVVILGSAMVFKATDVASYWFEARVQSKYVVWTQCTVFIVFAVVKVILILNNATVIRLAWAMFAEAAVSGIGLVFIFNWKGPGVIDRKSVV